MQFLAALRNNPRLRTEAAWVVAQKTGEAALQFVAVKLFTNLMGKEVFGEYNMVLTSALLLNAVALVPMQEAYLRYHHTATDDGVAGHAGRSLVYWFAVVTGLVVLLSAALSARLAGPLGLGTWSLLTGGLMFMTYHWRAFAIQFLDMQRLRPAATVQNLGFHITQAVLVSAALLLFGRSAAVGLVGAALAAGLFAVIGMGPFVRQLFARPVGPPSTLLPLVLSFGVPYGLLYVAQWVQGFSERYMLWMQLDVTAVGLYTAAFPLCGVPFMVAVAMYRAMFLPLAYQRAKDFRDARQLWAADRILLIGLALYVLGGALVLPIYYFMGPWLLRLLTNADFVLPALTLFALAAARYVQCLGLLLDAFFAVHQRMANSLAFRVLGGLLVVPICWYSIAAGRSGGARGGILGAALGILIASAVYIAVMTIGPGGCLLLLRRTCHQARAAGA